MNRVSILNFLGLPDSFNSVLLVFAFVLLLSPYFSGMDFGLFKIPRFTPTAKKRLQYIGPALFIISALLFIPIIPNPKTPQIDPTVMVTSATKDLSATINGDFDLQTRISGINALRSLADQNPPDDYYQQAIDILITYVKMNIADRKRNGPGITIDRDTYHAEDIIAAFKALQHIRETSKGKAEVKLIGIDFNNVNFDDLDCSYFDFSFSTFNNAIFGKVYRYTNFSFSTFDGAAIWNADFTGTNFHKANLHGAKFANVVFTNSNIEEASDFSVQLLAEPKGLTPSQLSLFNP
jgi:hypothetical protein